MEVPTCLLCNTYFDRKPLVNAYSEKDYEDKEEFERRVESVANDFKTALNLFWKLLKGELESDLHGHFSSLERNFAGAGFDGDNDRDRFRNGHPCCGECFEALSELYKLEEVIKETQAQQQEVLENLKQAVCSNQDRKSCVDKDWAKVRLKLLDYVSSPEINEAHEVLENTGEEIYKTETSHYATSGNYPDFDPPHSPCGSLPISYAESETGAPEADFSNSSAIEMETDTYREESLEPVVKRRRCRSSTVFTSKPATRSKLNLPNDRCEHPAAANMKPCFVKLTRLDFKNYPNLNVPERQSVELKMQQSISKVFPPLGRSKGWSYTLRAFFLINEELLLFFLTLIKFSPTGLTCMESNCTHFEEGSDYFTFENMKEHVIQCHERDYEQAGIPRSCPICEESFDSGFMIRRHILSDHADGNPRSNNYSTVVCERCWKPLPYQNYDSHAWMHKNDQEKATFLASGENIPARLRESAEFRKSSVLKKSATGTPKQSKKRKAKAQISKAKFPVSVPPTGVTSVKKLKSSDLSLPECNEGRELTGRSRRKSKQIYKEDFSYPSATESNLNLDSDSDYQPTFDQDQEAVENTEKRLKKIVSKASYSNSEDIVSNSNHDTRIDNPHNEGLNISDQCLNENQKTLMEEARMKLRKPFHYINEEILLFLCTPVKVSPTSFKCLEQYCDFSAEGSDYSAFRKMKVHVIQCHEKKNEHASRTCPICEETLYGNQDSRRHFLKNHVPSTSTGHCMVVCEICWKSMSIKSYFYHISTHKKMKEEALSMPVPEVQLNEQIAPKKREVVPISSSTKGMNTYYDKMKERVILLINTEILLFLCTPIKYSPAGFTCQEQNCSYFVKGSDYITYQNMKEHVMECHEKDYEAGTTFQSCPICEESCFTGINIRCHILNEHTAFGRGHFSGYTVICESCWKPMPYGSYACHIWRHKNAQEKSSMLASGEELNPKLKSRLGLNKGLTVADIQKSLEMTARGKRRRRTRMTKSDSKDAALVSVIPKSKPHFNNKIAKKRRKKIVRCSGKKSMNTYDKQRGKRVFLLINTDILLFLCTPIKYTPTGFTCLEQNCSYFVEGAEYFTFKNIQEHVIERHEKDYEAGKTFQSCPICEKTCFAGLNIRYHILTQHTTYGRDYFSEYTVICESCWKPMPYGSYACHIWRHKNAQEKSDVLTSGEELNPKLKSRLGLNKGRKETGDKRTHSGMEMTKLEPFEENTKVVLASSLKSKQKVHSDSALRSRQTKTTPEGYKSSNKLHQDGDDSNTADGMDFYLQQFHPENLFYLLGADILLCKDVLIKLSSTGFICQEEECGTEILGSDYNTFKLFRMHLLNKKRLRAPDYLQEARRTCPICNMEFIGILPFRDHIFNVHTPPAVCTSCWKPIQCYDDMKNHAELHMSEEDKVEVIDKKLTSAWHRGKRYRYYPKKKDHRPFPCKFCPMAFKISAHLRAHEVKHTPRHLRKHYDCPDCGRQVLSKSTLRSHIERAHRPELATKKRKCHICPKEFHFRDSNQYRRHIRAHTGEPPETPWICEICGKGFDTKYRFEYHSLTVHTTARPYQCEFCVMKYKTMKSLKRHQRSAHKELVGIKTDEETKLKFTNPEKRPDFIGPKIAYPCEYCGKVFQLRSRMTKHVKAAHRNANEVPNINIAQ